MAKKNKQEPKFIFDLEKITDFIFGNPNDKTNEVEITEKYVYDDALNTLKLNDKQVKEVKVNDYTGQNTIRYDLVRMMIDMIDGVDMFDEQEEMTLGQTLTWNTFQAYGFLKDVNE
jgi:hypothetical protein